MDLDRAIESALDGKALLFTGAGFSRGAVNLRNHPFKTGGQLATQFAIAVGLDQGTPLDDATDEFLQRFGPERLIKELELEFTASKVSRGHLQFAKIPWRRIYTTNYDNVLEHSFALAKQRLRAVTLSDQISDTPRDGMWCPRPSCMWWFTSGSLKRLHRKPVTKERLLRGQTNGHQLSHCNFG